MEVGSGSNPLDSGDGVGISLVGDISGDGSDVALISVEDTVLVLGTVGVGITLDGVACVEDDVADGLGVHVGVLV